jgi:uncharacterized SAM-binding protein YcdF (DUF218 family)
MRPVARRLLLTLILTLVLGAAAFLYYGGRYLQHEDALARADALFVLDGASVERWLEAYDLYVAGYAPRIVLSPGRLESAEALLRARGIRYPRRIDLNRDALAQLGVPADAIVTDMTWVDNTADEAMALRDMVRARGWRAVIVVTSKYHTRRTAFAFRRAFEGTNVRIAVRASRYDTSDPARWWRSRGDFRFVISEWQKLAGYRLGLGD